MRLPVGLRLALADVHVEVVVYLVDEADVFSGELAPGAVQRTQMSADVVRAVLVESVAARHIWQRCDQPLGLADQIGRVRRGLGQHRLAQRRIAGEGIDVTRLDPVEAQTERAGTRGSARQVPD